MLDGAQKRAVSDYSMPELMLELGDLNRQLEQLLRQANEHQRAAKATMEQVKVIHLHAAYIVAELHKRGRGD
jgi:hypothetical protein